jgi:hypothetical protein
MTPDEDKSATKERAARLEQIRQLVGEGLAQLVEGGGPLQRLASDGSKPTTRWPLPPASVPSVAKTREQAYAQLEHRLMVVSPANGVPDWWVPILLASMTRFRCGPQPARDVIEREQADEGYPLDDAAKVALEKAAQMVERVWPQ